MCRSGPSVTHHTAFEQADAQRLQSHINEMASLDLGEGSEPNVLNSNQEYGGGGLLRGLRPRIDANVQQETLIFDKEGGPRRSMKIRKVSKSLISFSSSLLTDWLSVSVALLGLSTGEKLCWRATSDSPGEPFRIPDSLAEPQGVLGRASNPSVFPSRTANCRR
jgi:hypothetical protein